MRRIRTLHKHQLEPALDLLVTRMLDCRNRTGLVEELFPLDLAATADQTGFTHQGPTAQQVGFQHQLDETRGFAAIGPLLQQ